MQYPEQTTKTRKTSSTEHVYGHEQSPSSRIAEVSIGDASNAGTERRSSGSVPSPSPSHQGVPQRRNTDDSVGTTSQVDVRSESQYGYSSTAVQAGLPEPSSGTLSPHVDMEHDRAGTAGHVSYSDLMQIGSDRSGLPSSASIHYGVPPPSPSSSLCARATRASRSYDSLGAGDPDHSEPYATIVVAESSGSRSSHRRDRKKRYLRMFRETFSPRIRHHDRDEDGGCAPGRR